DEEDRQGITYAPLDELLFDSDFVSIHTPYSTETHHFIGERELALMKPTAIFINTARGAVVDEEALVKALQTGYIATAGLDVFENQDNPHPTLCTLDNVCMTPHTGTQTADARRDMNAEMLENVVRFLAGRTDLNRVA
ncbi:MAG: NAD(P)-dependent oxidoreductase, partial [Porphyromonas pasteri]